ncbi:MAG: hypothetical protein WA484_00255 [Solirubrobacteraceae bacterium]
MSKVLGAGHRRSHAALPRRGAPGARDTGAHLIVTERYGSAPLIDVFGYEPGWPALSTDRREEVGRLLAGRE